MDLDAYREAMARLRAPLPPDRGELPRDPDSDHLPPGLEALDGQPVTIHGVDRATGELVHAQGALVPMPGLSGDLRRRGRA
jgi:hypothetical protein